MLGGLLVARKAQHLAVDELEHAPDLLQIAHCEHLRLCHPFVDFLNEVQLKVVHRHRVELCGVQVVEVLYDARARNLYVSGSILE